MNELNQTEIIDQCRGCSRRSSLWLIFSLAALLTAFALGWVSKDVYRPYQAFTPKPEELHNLPATINNDDLGFDMVCERVVFFRRSAGVSKEQ